MTIATPYQEAQRCEYGRTLTTVQGVVLCAIHRQMLERWGQLQLAIKPFVVKSS